MLSGAKRHTVIGTGRSVLAASALLLSGCGGRDPVDTPVNWWHQLEGGAIAQQRPPPPGVDAPYPRVGTTPAKPPPMLSADLRASLTEHLIEQRNLSTRLNADNPIVIPVTLPAAAPAAAAPAAKMPGASTGSNASGAAGAAPANPALSSATLDAAEAPPAPSLPDPSASGGSQTAVKPDGRPGDGTAAAQTGELAMPAIVPDQAGMLVAAGPTPPIANLPPVSPELPGFPVLAQPSFAAPAHPNYALGDQAGDRLLFPDGSDALSPGQEGILRTLATHRGAGGTVYVHGYGSAASDSPSDQAQALTLAALRARAVATALRERGVPASAIRIRADAFGRGATAGLVD